MLILVLESWAPELLPPPVGETGAWAGEGAVGVVPLFTEMELVPAPHFNVL